MPYSNQTMTTPLLQPQPPLSGDPSPAAIIPPALLADLTSPALSLTDVASRHNLSLSELSNFISRAAVSSHLASLHILAIEHARFLASFHVGQAVRVLHEVLKRGTADHDAAEPTLPAAPAEPTTPKSPALLIRASAIRARRLETLRRAATTVLQITRLNPPVFNCARAHAQLAHTLPSQPATAPTPSASELAPPTTAVPTPLAPAAPIPAQETPATFSEADLDAMLSSPPSINHNRSRHARDRDPESMLAAAGSARPHEHWP